MVPFSLLKSLYEHKRQRSDDFVDQTLSGSWSTFQNNGSTAQEIMTYDGGLSSVMNGQLVQVFTPPFAQCQLGSLHDPGGGRWMRGNTV